MDLTHQRCEYFVYCIKIVMVTPSSIGGRTIYLDITRIGLSFHFKREKSRSIWLIDLLSWGHPGGPVSSSPGAASILRLGCPAIVARMCPESPPTGRLSLRAGQTPQGLKRPAQGHRRRCITLCQPWGETPWSNLSRIPYYIFVF